MRLPRLLMNRCDQSDYGEGGFPTRAVTMAIAHRASLGCVAWLVITLLPQSAASQSSPAGNEPVAQAIQAELDQLMSPEVDTIQGARIALREPVHEFYARRAFRPAWTDARNAQQLRKALADSVKDGLDPEDYHAAVLEKLAAQVQSKATNTLRAQYDVLLTEALLRLAYHLSFGKVDPETFDPQWNYGRTLASQNVAQKVEEALAAEDIYKRIEALKPTHPLYVQLKQELSRYQAAVGSTDLSPIPPGPTLKPGASDSRVPLLRKRLIASGDLDASAATDSLEYDPTLVAAVGSFQQRMGLEGDGVLGPGSIAELNVPAADRIRQMRVNLDRGRVLLRDLPDDFVVVNIAGFNVYFVRGGKVLWQSRVQVGKPYRRTPIFRSEIGYLVLNPTWTVPPGILANDILPAARRDPSAITRKGLKVIDANGQELQPESIDWTQFKGGNIPYTLRQDPGPKNALGRVKLMFPNSYSVYLHDTPSQELFERTERSFSSGCVRVERVLELAELLLNDPQRWNQQSIARVLESGETTNVTLSKKVPVLLVYWTAWVDPKGRTNFRHDIYGSDAKWAEALDADFKLREKPLFATQ
jgi:L,D-transpeptidase YcbB